MASDVRLVAAQTLAAILVEGKTLAQLMPKAADRVAPRDQPLLQELCYGTCRWYPQLKQLYLALVDKPLKAKDTDIEALFYLGFYQLQFTRIAPHAAINETVNCAKKLKKPWAVKLLNAVLRRAQREQESLQQELQQNPQATTAHPNWLIKAITKHWPDFAEAIFASNNAHPPMTLRVNRAQTTRDDYQTELVEQGIECQATEYSDVGITLARAQDTAKLPGFAQGQASVQDEAAQLAASLLDLKPGQRVLDACAAPGGKTCHMLETEPGLARVTALDISDKRLTKVQENIQRINRDWLQGQVELTAADALVLEDWFSGDQYDRILLDAPCSATGVIRRHPDIKLLRLANQVEQLATLQFELLTALWQTLKPGGRLVYATCSIFPTENTQVIERFLQQTDDAAEHKLAVTWGMEQPAGRQLLPRQGGHDGFYYCVLDKR
ncbi:16S rRNA (cytosine(967)-C(5))-methyltransferase RsmB [Halioxenophilus aromaticivorans]|uniref:16S rRNA (cytosine(967)-C(5))-methyltransferase n=1 Tax=Halioxenophilus aromaticivorans TaxID=1306992 RepID=A0AAV3U898_9ALTE